jgi:hypothetical protein
MELLIVPLHLFPLSRTVQLVLGAFGLDDVFPQDVHTAKGGHFISDIFSPLFLWLNKTF